MRTMGRGMVLAAVLATALGVGSAAAESSNPNGLVFRALGFYRGEQDISEESIRCEIPTVEGAIAEGTFTMGLWNTFGIPNFHFPDEGNPVANPCGVWIQLQNNLTTAGINLTKIKLKYRVAGARRVRQFVPTQNGWPVACRPFRKETLFLGGRMNPAASDEETSISGRPNATLIELFPLVSANQFVCLRGQYGGVPVDALPSIPLVITATAYGTADDGSTYKANPIDYTLNLRHSCGNGRLDDRELCDPLAPGNPCVGFCSILSGETFGFCSQDVSVLCQTDADCQGTCSGSNNPTECACIY